MKGGLDARLKVQIYRNLIFIFCELNFSSLKLKLLKNITITLKLYFLLIIFFVWELLNKTLLYLS